MFRHAPGLLVLPLDVDRGFPCHTRPRLVIFTLNQWLPTGIHRHQHKPQHFHGVLSASASHCSILAHISTRWLAVLLSVSPNGEPHFQPFSYAVCTLFQITAFSSQDLGSSEGFQSLALSFLTKLRPWGAKVLQDELPHLKSDSSRRQIWALPLCSTPSVGSPVSANSILHNSHPGQR